MNVYKVALKHPKDVPVGFTVENMRDVARRLHTDADATNRASASVARQAEVQALRLRGDLWAIAAELVGSLDCLAEQVAER